MLICSSIPLHVYPVSKQIIYKEPISKWIIKYSFLYWSISQYLINGFCLLHIRLKKRNIHLSCETMTQKVQKSAGDLERLHQKNGPIPKAAARTEEMGWQPQSGEGKKNREPLSLKQWIMLECWMHLYKSQVLMSKDNWKKKKKVNKGHWKETS